MIEGATSISEIRETMVEFNDDFVDFYGFFRDQADVVRIQKSTEQAGECGIPSMIYRSVSNAVIRRAFHQRYIIVHVRGVTQKKCFRQKNQKSLITMRVRKWLRLNCFVLCTSTVKKRWPGRSRKKP